MIALAFALVGIAAVLTIVGTAADSVALLLGAIAVAVVALLVLAVGVARASARRRQSRLSADGGVADDRGAAEGDGS
ncbi:MAG: hypothetical protein ACLFRD_06950 [Nitriliruptoraceae bacterium]